MGWIRDRRGYGELRLRLRRRQARAGSWLSGELRRRRQQVLRRHWRLVAGWLASWAGLAFLLAVLAHGRPWLQGAVVGAYATLAVGGLWLGLMMLDGSMLARLGRDTEEQVGDELRRAPSSYGVISGLRFERHDVDHVLLSRSGVMAVEVKYLSGQRRSLRNTPRLADHVAQTVDGAARTRRLLRSRGVDVPVAPLLVLAGPGAPDLDGRVITEGSAQIAAFRDSDHWLATLATRSPRLNLPTARAAADTLLGFQDQRRQHEAANGPLSAPGAGEPAARTKPVAKRRHLRVGGGFKPPSPLDRLLRRCLLGSAHEAALDVRLRRRRFVRRQLYPSAPDRLSGRGHFGAGR